jgi:lipopolysaccharide transport system permease protein
MSTSLSDSSAPDRSPALHGQDRVDTPSGVDRSAGRGDDNPYADELVLEAGRASRHYWRDLWRYRELFYILAWRDVSVRYKQTVLGVAWALIQPVLTMAIMTIVFGYVAKLPTEGDAPYAILVFAGMLPWQFFATALAAASASLVGNANLISKVYFPRLIIPASSVLTSFVDFLISFSVLVALMAWYRFVPTWQILALPFLMMLAFLAAMGPGLLMTALNVKYRDFRYMIPFVIQFGLYASPVGFSSSVVRDRFGETAFAIYSLNPMVGIIDGFRWAILGNADFHATGFAISCSVVVAFLVAGVWYFRRTEQSFADVI